MAREKQQNPTKATAPARSQMGGKMPKNPNFSKGLPADAGVTPEHIEAAARVLTKHRRKRRVRSGTRALREIRQYQKSTDFLVPKASMRRLLAELIREHKDDGRLTKGALAALREVAELYVTERMADAQVLAIHAKRMNVMPVDFRLAVFIDNRATLALRTAAATSD